jgi:hypothetical protein
MLHPGARNCRADEAEAIESEHDSFIGFFQAIVDHQGQPVEMIARII